MRKTEPQEKPLSSLPLEERERCKYCDASILWGEPYEIALDGHSILCSGCARRPLFRNGPATATEAACVKLRQENSRLYRHLERLREGKDKLETAAEILTEFTSVDITHPDLRTASNLVTQTLELFRAGEEANQEDTE